jgi:hypothetical protein
MSCRFAVTSAKVVVRERSFTMSKKVAILTGFLLILAAAIPASAKPLNKGWWIVVGSFPTEPAERQKADFDRMSATAARCHLHLFNDQSGKFRGFASGHNVFVVGAFASRTKADGKLREARRCFPGAYVKFGEWLGE